METRNMSYEYGTILVALTTAIVRLIKTINEKASNDIIHTAYSNYDLDITFLDNAKHELYQSELEKLFIKIRELKIRTRIISDSQTESDYERLKNEINDNFNKIRDIFDKNNNSNRKQELMKVFEDQFNIIQTQTNLCIEQLKNELAERKKTVIKPSSFNQEKFYLELIESSNLKEAIENYELTLANLKTKIYNLKNKNPDEVNPKVELLEYYYNQMNKIDRTNINNLDIGTLQVKRVNFALEHPGQHATIKNEPSMNAKAATRPILGAILMTTGVLLGLAAIALCLTIKLAPIGLVGLALSLKLLMVGSAMVGLTLSSGSLYFFKAQTDLTSKTDNVLQKLPKLAS